MASRVFPIPAGPKTVTTRGRCSATTWSQIRRKTASSWSRPTIGSGWARRSPGAVEAASAIQAGTGELLPLRLTGSTGW